MRVRVVSQGTRGGQHDHVLRRSLLGRFEGPHFDKGHAFNRFLRAMRCSTMFNPEELVFGGWRGVVFWRLEGSVEPRTRNVRELHVFFFRRS